MRQAFPPNDLPAEAWLGRYGTPEILPDWPVSPNMTVVAVWEVDEGVTEAWVCLSPAELDNLLEREEPILYFSVPKQILLKPDVCPGLTMDMFA